MTIEVKDERAVRILKDYSDGKTDEATMRERSVRLINEITDERDAYIVIINKMDKDERIQSD